jgi:hypothetical protein
MSCTYKYNETLYSAEKRDNILSSFIAASPFSNGSVNKLDRAQPSSKIDMQAYHSPYISSVVISYLNLFT